MAQALSSRPREYFRPPYIETKGPGIKVPSDSWARGSTPRINQAKLAFQYTVTNAGIDVGAPNLTPDFRQSAAGLIHEIRRLSGMTFKTLASVIGVDRRSVHYWTSGEAISEDHRVVLQKVRDTLCFIDRGNQAANKALLATVLTAEETGLNLLVENKFRVLQDLAGTGAARRIKLSRVDRDKTPSRGLHPDGWLGGLDTSAFDETRPLKTESIATGRVTRRVAMPKR
jgi:hypothetical protein